MNNLISLPKSLIDQTVKESPDFMTAFMNLYRIAIQEFDSVKQINGFPIISEKTACYIIDQLLTMVDDPFRINSLWLNNGFSADDSIPDWKISLHKVSLIY